VIVSVVNLFRCFTCFDVLPFLLFYLCRCFIFFGVLPFSILYHFHCFTLFVIKKKKNFFACPLQVPTASSIFFRNVTRPLDERRFHLTPWPPSLYFVRRTLVKMVFARFDDIQTFVTIAKTIFTRVLRTKYREGGHGVRWNRLSSRGRVTFLKKMELAVGTCSGQAKKFFFFFITNKVKQWKWYNIENGKTPKKIKHRQR
jgi:hypothetical protein